MTPTVMPRPFALSAPPDRFRLIALPATLLIFLTGVPVTGCSLGYLLHVGEGQAKIVFCRERVEKVMRTDRLPPAEREKVQVILEAKSFGETVLGLTRSRNYMYFYQVDGPHVAYNLTASPRLELRAHHWCFPIAGCLPYLGFFEKERALREEKKMSDQGFDTYLRPVAAYSTLGWFVDPIFSSLLRYDVGSLVEIVLHEMVHRTVFVKNQGAFNEGAATFIGEKGALVFFAQQGEAGLSYQEALERKWQREQAFEDRMQSLATRLRALYASELDDAEKLRKREEEFRKERDAYREGLEPALRSADSGSVRQDWNNAFLMSYLTYHQDDALWEAVYERFHGNLSEMVSWLKGFQNVKDPLARVRDELDQSGHEPQQNN